MQGQNMQRPTQPEARGERTRDREVGAVQYALLEREAVRYWRRSPNEEQVRGVYRGI